MNTGVALWSARRTHPCDEPGDGCREERQEVGIGYLVDLACPLRNN